MMSMRAPGLRYVEPAVATTVASTREPSPAGARSSSNSRLVSSRTSRSGLGMTHIVSKPSTPSRKSFRGSRGPEVGVRGMPSPFINLDERGRHTPHSNLLPLMLMRKDFLDEVLAYQRR